MGREVRRVPAGWVHPKNDRGDYRPMYDEDFESAAKKWKAGFLSWENGSDPDRAEEDCEWWEWQGDPPDRERYRPKWEDAERTHFQMYETTTEGTPISPVFATPEELARWLADNGASSFADRTATYEQWLRVCKGGHAPSAVYDDKGLRSGVEALAERERPTPQKSRIQSPSCTPPTS